MTVDTAINPLTLNSFLTGFGMSISNLVVTCDPASIGTFISNGSNVGMTDGLALSSGHVMDIPGPNDQPGTSSAMGTPGDIDLGSISGISTFDACIVEFDCVPQYNSLLFNFVFGSEEYLEFTGTPFNDVFAIFISGPGFTGQQNIALIPGTSTPVSINNVNDVNNSAFYIDNGNGASPPQNTDPMVVQYDGFTTNIIGEAFVQANSTYHLKFAVADGSDQVFDSGVMIEANSVRSMPSVGITENMNVSNAHVLWDANSQDHVLKIDEGGKLDIQILDMRGSLIRSWQDNSNGPIKIGSNALINGAYILIVEGKNGSEAIRFIK